MPKDKSGNCRPKNNSISKISISGFKSYPKETSIDIRPLTVLAGSNSSGKSSIIQPLLLMKQTLEKIYDPGVFLLDGAHVHFTRYDQILSDIPGIKKTNRFSISVELDNNVGYKSIYKRSKSGGLTISEQSYWDSNRRILLKSGWKHNDIIKKNSFLKGVYDDIFSRESDSVGSKDQDNVDLKIVRSRCFLQLDNLTISAEKGIITYNLFNVNDVIPSILKIIHLPALRGNPQRLYPKTSVGKMFPGTFENYTASIIAMWKENNDPKLEKLFGYLKDLRLTENVDIRNVDDANVEILVNKLPVGTSGHIEWVNIVDVGFGVSQTLPLLVALLTADKGQMVYIEQPEIHLHPKAQYNLAKIIVDAAKRGVRVVLETHSDLLILAIQTLVAEGQISHKDVLIHWFQRKQDGSTVINNSELNIDGSYNSETWPEDFGDILLYAQDRFLEASEKCENIVKKIQTGVD